MKGDNYRLELDWNLTTNALKNCPDMKMDGDGDGVPCEQPLCTGLFGV